MLGLVELRYGSDPKSSFWHRPGVVILTLRRSRRWKNPRIGSASPLRFRDLPQVVPNDVFGRNLFAMNASANRFAIFTRNQHVFDDFSSKFIRMTSLAAHITANRLKQNKFPTRYPLGGGGGEGGRTNGAQTTNKRHRSSSNSRCEGHFVEP
jgi:hypothetical protein